MLKSGMQKYQASVIKSAGSSLLGKISAFGSMMKEQKEELMDKKIQASLPSSKKSADPSKKSE